VVAVVAVVVVVRVRNCRESKAYSVKVNNLKPTL